MKELLAALTTMIISCQSAMAEVPPPGVVKFRTHLEHMRLEVLRENLLMMKTIDQDWTKADDEYLVKHTTQESANAVGEAGGELLQALTKTIVDLGGQQELTDEEKASLKKSLSDNTPESIPMLDPNSI